MSVPAANERLAELATELVQTEGQALALTADEMPEAVRENFALYRRSVERTISAAQHLQEDRDEIAAKADLLPRAGVDRLRREAKEAGRSFAQAQGVDAEKVVSRARTVVSLSAAERSSDPYRVLASKALQGLGRLKAARGAAEAYHINIQRG